MLLYLYGGPVNQELRLQSRVQACHLQLDPWATRRRRNLLELLDQLDRWIEQLDQAVAQEAERCREAVYLMKQPGVLMGNTKR